MGDNPFGVKLKATNNKFAQEILAPAGAAPPPKPAQKAVGKAAPSPKPPAKASSKALPPKQPPVPPNRETEKLDTEPKFAPPSDPDPFKKPAKDSSLNRAESSKEKEDILEPIEVKQVRETPVQAGRDRAEMELLEMDSDSKLIDSDDELDNSSKSFENKPTEHKRKHRRSHRHHHHREHQIPQPYNLMPPYNNNYRFCYYYHLPPPPPSLMKIFKEQAREREGYFQSPFNEKYLVPPTLLYVPGADQMQPQHFQQTTSYNQRAFSKPSSYFM